jgi:hypothetical protein
MDGMVEVVGLELGVHRVDAALSSRSAESTAFSASRSCGGTRATSPPFSTWRMPTDLPEMEVGRKRIARTKASLMDFARLRLAARFASLSLPE